MPEVIFPGPDGRLEGRYHPQKAKDAPIAIILHPHPLYGGTMNNKVVYNLHYAFHRIGFTCLRFNFRGVGRSQGEYDQGIGELSDAAAALDYLQSLNANAKNCWVAGFSFGAWIGMQLLMRRPEIAGFVSVAPPANQYDFSFLAPCPSSGLILSRLRRPRGAARRRRRPRRQAQAAEGHHHHPQDHRGRRPLLRPRHGRDDRHRRRLRPPAPDRDHAARAAPRLPDPGVLLPFALAVVVIALTPGPDMAFFLGRAVTQGRAAGLAALLGATSGILVHTTLVAVGLSALIVAAPAAFLALKLAGARSTSPGSRCRPSATARRSPSPSVAARATLRRRPRVGRALDYGLRQRLRRLRRPPPPRPLPIVQTWGRLRLRNLRASLFPAKGWAAILQGAAAGSNP